MSTGNIVFLDRATIGPGITLRSPSFKHNWQDYQQTEESDVVARLANTEIAITNKVSITQAMLQKLPALRCIAVAATGANMLDLHACHTAGVTVCNIRGYAQHTVPEHTFSTILALRRNLLEYREDVLSGKWQESEQFCFFNRPIRELHGTTLGILGTGNIALEVGRLGEAFGMRVHYHSLSRRKDLKIPLVDFPTLISSADVLSIHCPLNDLSDGIINDEVFAAMKETALLINTARGEIVKVTALQSALENNLIAGAAIDVCEQEPPPLDSIIMKLASRPDMLLTPHMAWGSVEAMQILADQLIDNIDAYHRQTPQNVL